jgi:endonuclease/exonuclease/phosphatase family metal-dependent hydrolase
LSFQVSNDEQFLFIKLEVDSEINLKEDDPIEHSIYLYLDTDNDAQTGFNVQPGFGSELGINFSNLTANYDVATSTTVDFTDIRLRMSPTVTSTLFEIALARDAVPDNVHPLFTGTTIKLLFKNWTNGDNMPDEGTFFTYSFDETPVEPLIPLGLNKSMPEHIRVVAYNTLFDGLLEAQRIPHFQSIIQALNPDIIAFSECYDTPSSTVENLLDSWLPLNNNEGWHVVKKGDLITASRWPVLQFWPFITRSFPVLIDLPDTYPKDLLITNAHLSCCDNNSGRQDQIDEYNSFFKQLKAGGAGLGFTEMTPFIYAGDLNLVGYAQQLDALRTGEIDNINQYGIGAPPDWDDSPITDELAIQTDKRMAYTWRNDFSAYPPGRLDFIFYSDYVMNVEKSFVLQTEVMSSERLALYDLNVDDTGKASDHFPVVADFTLNVLDQVEETGLSPHKVFPNPVDDYLTINLADGVEAELVIRDVSGKVFFRQNSVKDTLSISMQNIPAGVYFVVITEKTGKVFSHKVIKE